MIKNRGFSLLELLIVTSIIVVIASIGTGFYLNYSKNVEINSIANVIVFDLKQVQSKAMIGEGGFKWGIHFVNNTTTFYYEIFSTPTDFNDAGKVIIYTNYLTNGVTFSSPGSDSSTDIIFNKISGGTAGTSVVIISQSNTRTISVSSIGNISVQ